MQDYKVIVYQVDENPEGKYALHTTVKAPTEIEAAKLAVLKYLDEDEDRYFDECLAWFVVFEDNRTVEVTGEKRMDLQVHLND